MSDYKTVNERNAFTLLGEIEVLQGRVARIESSIEEQTRYVQGVQTAIMQLSDQVMGLLTWRATEEQNRGDDD